MRFYTHVLYIAIFFAAWSCGEGYYHDYIDETKNTLGVSPDSALTLLDRLDINSLGEHKAYAYYLKGKANLNLNNYPAAMEAFLHAEKLSESAGNDSLLALSRRAMMDLSDSICDFNEKARYAIKACEVYERHDDYDNIYDVLSKFTGFNPPEERPYKYANDIIHYAHILNENDTTRAYFYADTLERRSERLYAMLDNLGSLNITSWQFIDGIKSFNPQRLIYQIIRGNGWKEEISNDSSDISAQNAHLVATSLWEQGHTTKAHEFINYYRLHYPEKIINYSIDTVSKKFNPYLSYRLLDTKKEEFRATFQDDVRAAVTKFQYEEVMMHEQTIRFQRAMIITITALTIAIAVAVGMYLRMTAMRRRRREESDMQSAAELRATLHDLEVQHIDTLTRLCDTYYENYSNEKTKSKTARDTLAAIEEMAASAQFIARLEKHLDNTAGGIMTLLRNEMPDLKDSDLRLFLYNALGLSIPAICLLLGERREVIYNRRIRLRTKIQDTNPPHRDAIIKYLR